jgi:hypothetical protein
MPIVMACKDCYSELTFPDEVAGQRVRCPRCDARLVAPGRAAPRQADTPREPAPAREERLRATKPAKAIEETVEEPVRPKRPAATAEGRVRATRPAKPDVDPEPEDAEAQQEPPAKKKSKPKRKSESEGSALKWWLLGGAIGFILLLGGVVVVAVVSMKQAFAASGPARPAEEPDEAWVDVRTASRLIGPDPVVAANIGQIYAMGGECKFAKGPDHPLVAVRLHSFHATDGMMSVFRAFPKLRSLDLSNCRLSDTGLQQFFAMTQLEEINIKNTMVTPQGVITLHQSLPKLKITY